jgi:ABC-type transport system involved in multi-copper enzyme maturation permease subunit
MYDHAYFIISIVGFITILVGIFCAYKLFGQDRKNGKMDLLLSQNVTFNQVFVAKFIAIVLITSFYLALFSILSLIWGALIYGSLPNAMLAVFNLTNVYTIHPFMFFLIKVIGIELQVIFYSIITIFLMNVSRKFELCFGISAGLFVVATICNIFLNGAFVYCLFPFIHADLTSFLGGATMSTGFLKTSLYTYGNFLISVLYYLVVVALLFNFTKQLFKKN